MHHILVIDSYPVSGYGFVQAFQTRGSSFAVTWVEDQFNAELQLNHSNPWNLVVLDLNLAKSVGDRPQDSVGIELLGYILENKSYNILVLGDKYEDLSQFCPFLEIYPLGLVLCTKFNSLKEILKLCEAAMMKRKFCSPLIRMQAMTVELKLQGIKESWLEALRYRAHDAMSDRSIALKMDVSERTVRNYWLHLAKQLQIDPSAEFDFHMQIILAASQRGWIE